MTRLKSLWLYIVDTLNEIRDYIFLVDNTVACLCCGVRFHKRHYTTKVPKGIYKFCIPCLREFGQEWHEKQIKTQHDLLDEWKGGFRD